MLLFEVSNQTKALIYRKVNLVTIKAFSNMLQNPEVLKKQRPSLQILKPIARAAVLATN